MSSNPKWQPGAVKLTTGEDAIIQYIQESDSKYRYIGMSQVSNGRSWTWKPMAWTDKGIQFPYCTEESRNLAPPPKKTVRVERWILVCYDGSTIYYASKPSRVDLAISAAKQKGFGLFKLDREVTEGEGLD